MNNHRVTANGHEVPHDLVAAITAGWVDRISKAEVGAALGFNCSHLRLYSLDYITGRLIADWRSAPSEYLGAASDDRPPGDIDRERSVVVGEIEPESPVAVDFRTTPPSVVALIWPGWIRLAATTKEFLELLDPGGELRGP